MDNVRIVAKVENRRAMGHLDEIVRVADAIMIDRGDLSVETALESVALSQKQILRAARVAACPVIVATEMLHSMIAEPEPDEGRDQRHHERGPRRGIGADALGRDRDRRYPVEVLGTMRRTADRAWDFLQGEAGAFAGGETTPEAMGDAIALICRRAPVTKIVAITISGFAARMVSAQRPRQPIIAVSNRAASARAFNLLAGVAGVFMDVPFVRDSTDHIAACLEGLRRRQLLCDDDITLVVSLVYPEVRQPHEPAPDASRRRLARQLGLGPLMHRMAWAGQVGETDRQTIFGLRGPVMELVETTTSSGIVGRPEVVRAVTRFKPDGNRIYYTRYGGDYRFISRYVFTYDDGDRRGGPRFYAGSPDRLDHVVRFTYEESGRRRRMQEQLTPDGALMFTVGFEYDELDRGSNRSGGNPTAASFAPMRSTTTTRATGPRW